MENHREGGTARAARVIGAVAGAAALSVSTIGFAAAASAQTQQPSRPGNTHTVYQSSFLGGYSATPAGGLASASVAFKIPTVNCPVNGTQEMTYFGAYTALVDVFALIQIFCNGVDPAQYSYSFGTPAGTSQEPAAAGDTVVTSIFQTSSTSEAEIHDITNGEYWVADDSSRSDTTVELGALTGTQYGYLEPAFSPVSVYNAELNGDYLGFQDGIQYDAVDGNRVTVKCGNLKTNARGTSFTLTYKSP